MEKRFAAFAALAALAAISLYAAGTAFAGGGNSDAAQACQKGGYANIVGTTNGLPDPSVVYGNAGDCTSYAAHGGTLTKPKSAARLLCESVAGVFAPGSGNTLWFCTYTWSSAAYDALVNRCFADGGNAFGIVSGNAGGVRMDACWPT